MHGGTLGIADPTGAVIGSTSGPSLSLSGSLAAVNTVLAHLTDTLQSDSDVVHMVVTDSGGHTAVRDVGVRLSSAVAPASPGPSSAARPRRRRPPRTASSSSAACRLERLFRRSRDRRRRQQHFVARRAGAGAYSTASLTIGGTLEVHSGGAAHFTGALSANAVTVDPGGAIAGGGTLTALAARSSTTARSRRWRILTLGLQRLTVTNALAGSGYLIVNPGPR